MIELLKEALEIFNRNTSLGYIEFSICAFITLILSFFIEKYSGNFKKDKNVIIRILVKLGIVNALLFLFDNLLLFPFLFALAYVGTNYLYKKYIQKMLEKNEENVIEIGNEENIEKDNITTTAEELEEEIKEEMFKPKILEGQESYFDPNHINKELLYQADYGNLLDILVLYNYISTNQRSRFYDMVFADNPEKEINKLLEMKVLTPEELEEAKVVQNLIRKEKRLVSREEANLLLMRVKRNKEGENNER